MSSLAPLLRANVRLLSVLTAVALCLSLSPQPGFAAAAKLVANGTFDTNVKGWATNQSYTTLTRTTSAHDGAGAAVLTTKAGKNAVLNDEPNSVSSAKKGAHYAVSVWVKTEQPSLSGQLRVRQVSTGGTTTSGTSFWLTSKSWQKVSLDLVTARDGSALDVSVLGWSMAKGQTLYVDTVSLTLVPPGVPATAPTGSVPTGKYSMSDGAGVSARGVPLSGALFG
ncbi:MAG: carbohydrate binding domain-containing protein, partial [Janthinobacterium lividum]